MMLMFSLPDNFAQAFIDFFTIFLVTIPSQFITELLDGGILLTVWNTFFGNANVISLLVILALVIGVWTMITKPAKGRSRL